MANIDYVIFLTRHSSGYANFLIRTGEALKSGKHNINWKCVLSNSAKKIPKGFECINKFKSKAKTGSLRHGLTINDTLSKISSEYVIISDCDVALTYKNWDDEIVKVLEDFDCFGVENMRREREAINFPNVPFICFKKNIMEQVDLDFTPIIDKNKDIKRIVIKTKEEASKSGRNIGERVILNTGCRLATTFREAGFSSQCLKSADIRSENIQLKFNNDQDYKDIVTDKLPIRSLSEFHYRGNVFVTHVGRSSSNSFRRGPVKNWSERVENYIKNKHGIDI